MKTQLISEYKLISNVLFAMNVIDNEQKIIAAEYSRRMREISNELGMDHLEIINY